MSDDRERLLDIVEHLDLIERHRPVSLAALEADEVLAAAMVRWIEVVGEAASHVGPDAGEVAGHPVAIDRCHAQSPHPRLSAGQSPSCMGSHHAGRPGHATTPASVAGRVAAEHGHGRHGEGAVKPGTAVAEAVHERRLDEETARRTIADVDLQQAAERTRD